MSLLDKYSNTDAAGLLQANHQQHQQEFVYTRIYRTSKLKTISMREIYA